MSLDPDNELQKQFEGMVHHVVLPRVLPNENPPDNQNIELMLLARMADAVDKCSEWIPLATVRFFERLKRIHKKMPVKPMPEDVLSEINAIKPGEMFGMFVRRQNTAFIIEMPREQNSANEEMKTVIVSTFSGNVHPKEIYSHSSDLECHYPAQALKVKYSKMMRSKEFAEQLCTLYDTLPILPTKAQSRTYANTWLTSVLSDEDTVIAEYSSIKKKVRDEMIGESRKSHSAFGSVYSLNKSNYFRRSNFYMTTKVFLHLNLTRELGADSGRFLYKLVMLRFLTELCCEFKNAIICPQLDIDLVGQLMAKIARRIEKFQGLSGISNSNFYKEVVSQAKAAISALRDRSNNQIDKLQKNIEKMTQLEPLINLNFESDIFQQVPKLRKHLATRKTENNANDTTFQYKLFSRHEIMQPSAPEQLLMTDHQDPVKRHLCLVDFENWILYQLNLQDNRFDYKILYDLYKSYDPVATNFHADDQLGISRMMLVRLKLLAVMDQIITNAYPMLLQHRSGVDIKIFDVLLLPQSIDMKIAFDLQNYFNNRNNIAIHPGLIERTDITSDSFSVKYARCNSVMQNAKNEILQMGERKIEEKRREWERERHRKQQLINETRGLSHKYYTSTSSTGRTYQEHSSYCELCRLEREIERVKIETYERPLPDCVDKKDAIAFELRIPNEVAALRDILYFTTKFGQTSIYSSQRKGPWISYDQVRQQNQFGSWNVKLETRYTWTPDKYDVDYSFESFIISNGRDCMLHGSNSAVFSSIPVQNIKKLCTLNVDSGSPYEGLQWALNSTTHSQNQVLARQYECPQNLSISEFKEFASLRADGHRLQLRKLYAMIAAEALSFDQGSVLSLILQTIYETGVCGDIGYARESHEDFIDSNFVQAMITLLEKFVEHQKENWAHPLKMLTIVLISTRIFELNDSNELIANQLIKLLNSIRAILVQWLNKIECSIRKNQSDTSLRIKLANVSIAAALTFFINSKHPFFDKIFETTALSKHTAPWIWLRSIVTLNSNTLLMAESERNECQLKLRKLVRLVRYTGVHIESKIRDSIRKDPKDAFELIREQWALSTNGRFLEPYFAENCPQVFIVFIEFENDKKSHVTIDLITGSFLVNNLPVARLPEQIVSNAEFGRVFDDFIFEIQPDTSSSFTTVQKYNECSYKFNLHSDSTIMITEHRANNIQIDLIPIDVLTNDVPELLIEKHSHWWHKNKNIIEFRPKKFQDPNFSCESGIEYILDMKASRLIEKRTGRPMLDVRSKSYDDIRNYLKCLERLRFIHVLIDVSNTKVANVELIRMNLKFKIDSSKANNEGNYDMISNEFSHMRISSQQNCGTLYGLNSGLLLESVSNKEESKQLIVPHSSIRSMCTENHVNVHIELQSELRNPPFHLYQVDKTMRQLTPINKNFSAWLYLAYLHAITSHGEVEPLTGMSGTERAIQILQSGFVWSLAPYNNEEIKILQSIAQLTPHRHLKDNIQLINWPAHILTHCAHDTFVLIIRKLFDDSKQLTGLHLDDPNIYNRHRMSDINDAQLNIRDYRRCLELKPNLRLKETFIRHEVLQTSKPNVPQIIYSQNTRRVSSIYHRQALNNPLCLNLKEHLKSKGSLDGPIHVDTVHSILNQNVNVNFENLWISLYEVARSSIHRMNREQFGLILTLFSHQHNELNLILALQAVFEQPDTFGSIDPPLRIDHYEISEGSNLNTQNLYEILERSYSKPWEYDNKYYCRNSHDQEIRNNKERLVDFIKCKWPCDEVNLSSSGFSVSGYISLSLANLLINEKLLIWNNNRKLWEFVEKIEEAILKLASITAMDHSNLSTNAPYADGRIWTKYSLNYEKKMCENLANFPDETRQAENEWQSNNNLPKYSAEEWWKIYKQMFELNNKHLVDAGMNPRMVPSLILSRITCEKTNPILKSVIGALALSIVREQQSHRIRNYESDPQLKPALDRELENVPHINWKPCEYPEWLLFEIEQNLTIRRIQVKIAKRMINPPEIGTKHSVMQLNMGEGKTAVIVPILAAVLANGDQACQITVLKSLFATNLNSLRQYLGGMLNRRMYTFPCRRDMPIAQYVPQMISIYEKCKKERGVILTLPEYRLSFQLKIYESVKKGDIDNARHFLNVHKWINANVRSILDESDAILNAKYQLIYTVGSQLPLDGSSYRWSVAQALLKRVPHHMKNLHADEECKEKIEFDRNYVQNGHIYGAPKVDYRPDVFTPCRILDESIYDRIKKLLIDDFLQGRLDIILSENTASNKEKVKQFLSKKKIDAEYLESIRNRQNSTIQPDILYTLSGLLRFEVLKLVLMRRWRVNYGVNEKGKRKMAIPFKAKDVAAEMTEFGHPDVAICLTQLSYYYSGLTDDQMMRVFEILKTKQNAAEIYRKWINSIPSELVEASVQSYTGVNLNDPTQRDGLLFPLLRFNMQTIDFWLSTDVFPREAKAFENKLICTAWDLCSDHMQHQVTGFSGTNDTKNILPLPIAQNDLEELEQTNENVRKTLLRPENQAYQKLPPNVSGKEILKRLVDNDIPILLDAGALMLELNNKQMAAEWLKIAPPKFDATVYFDSKDVLQTIDRNGLVAAFDCSVYRDNLSRCLVYLDDVHTRGTDLKFPLGWKACVTLSGDIARDKTVQACMRMRQLGKGHSIAFWASHEADIRIRETSKLPADDSITNEHVIEFICSNSRRFETENTVHWAAAGHNYTKKMAGHKLHENSSDENAMSNLYETCVDNEFVTLENMYGDMEEVPLTEISNAKLDNLHTMYITNDNISRFIVSIKDSVDKKLTKQAPEVKRFKHALDEEQEKELEKEREEERQIERPPQMNPANPFFNEKLRDLFLNRFQFDDLKSTGVLVSLSSSLSNTQLFHSYAQEIDPWSENLFVTRDFVRVLETTSQCCDEFLRPVWWIGGIQINDKSMWILLSSYECDRLISTFRSSKKSTLLMYRPRISKLHDNLIRERGLRVTQMTSPMELSLKYEVQIGVYAGSMYFKTEAEQNAFCSFLGLIPRPRTIELEAEFENGFIKPNGFVPYGERQRSESMKKCVGDCRFIKNPVDLVMKLINAHHEFMRQESHVAHIVERGIKMSIESDENSPSDGSESRMDVDDDQQTNNREKAIKRSSESLMEPEPSTSKQMKFN